jgi:aspartate/methionine/tyrosine aminotransferase
MNINHSPVTYSSIVEIGERVSFLEKSTQNTYLKLHRGVMDVDLIDLNSFMSDFDYNQKNIQHYGGNDGDSNLIEVIKDKFNLNKHYVMNVPGGMSTLDLVINSLSDCDFWLPKYHWGSWNKILKIHNKNIKEFNDFDIENFKAIDPITGNSGVVMLCYPSNPTGWQPDFINLKKFLEHCKEKNITVILDLPYYYLFNDDSPIYKLFYDNVIILSSFSKSMGLSGLRIGYIATKNQELYNSMKIRSLYKYNSISTIPQQIIGKLLTTNNGKLSLDNYKRKTKDNITMNIQYLKDRKFLFDEYPSTPTGPFAIVNINFDILLSNRISSVPLHKFSLNKNVNKQYSRISVAVPHELFKKYFDKIILSNEELEKFHAIEK